MWQRSTRGSASSVLCALSAVLVTVSLQASAQSDIYNSASNLQGYINSFGTFTQQNMIYLVREGYDGELTVADLNAGMLSDSQAQARCEALLQDLTGAPAAERVTNVWILFGLEGLEEGHRVCRGQRQ